MSVCRLFELATTLCLILAVLCLASVEPDELRWFYEFVMLVILVASLPRRGWEMPAQAANVLALLILAAWLGWAYVGVQRDLGERGEGGEFIRWLLLRVGPLLCTLQLAKLFRPKQANDWWLLHGVALIEVTLACVLAMVLREDRSNPVFAIALLGYAFAAVWSLALFYVHRESTAGDAGAALPPLAAPSPSSGQTSRKFPFHLGLGTGAFWFVYALLLGLALFLLAPRLGGEGSRSWLTGTTHHSYVGFHTGIDLRRGNWPELSDQLVARVTAFDATGEKVILGSGPRWRGATCTIYRHGAWTPSGVIDLSEVSVREPLRPGPNDLRLSFEVEPAALSTLAFDPQHEANALTTYPLPVLDVQTPFLGERWVYTSQAGMRLEYRQVERVLIANTNVRLQSLHYEQLVSPAPTREIDFRHLINRRPVMEPEGRQRQIYLTELQSFQQQPELEASGRILDVAQKILERRNLPGKRSRLDTAERLRAKAHALEQALNSSPDEFAYSLGRPWIDPTLDPTEDFLLNPVKMEDGRLLRAGRCEHFASALALMLRSQGIPARVVIGFYGADWNANLRVHEIRQYHAHAWVEAFIGNREADGFVYVGEWITLDPTPGAGEASRQPRELGVFGNVGQQLRYLWETFVLDYRGTLNPRGYWERTAAGFKSFGNAFVSRLANPMWMAGAACVLAALVLLRYWRRRRRIRALIPVYHPLLQRLEQLLAPSKLSRSPSQTPEEFSVAAERALASRLHDSRLARLPSRLIAFFYGLRYGGRPADQAAEQALHADLDALQAALVHARPATGH